MPRKKKKSMTPLVPLPNPNLGDANLPTPVDQADHASFAPSQSKIGLAEPEGELDPSSIRTDAERPVEQA